MCRRIIAQAKLVLYVQECSKYRPGCASTVTYAIEEALRIDYLAQSSACVSSDFLALPDSRTCKALAIDAVQGRLHD